jgi:hypothetical protein
MPQLPTWHVMFNVALVYWMRQVGDLFISQNNKSI